MLPTYVPLPPSSTQLSLTQIPIPSDLALIEDPAFAPWVKAYANDKDLFYTDFSAVFSKLIELGVNRSERPYEAASKKSNEPGAPEKGTAFGKTKL